MWKIGICHSLCDAIQKENFRFNKFRSWRHRSRRPVLAMSSNLGDSKYFIGKTFSTWNNKIHNDYQDNEGYPLEKIQFLEMFTILVSWHYIIINLYVHDARECGVVLSRINFSQGDCKIKVCNLIPQKIKLSRRMHLWFYFIFCVLFLLRIHGMMI